MSIDAVLALLEQTFKTLVEAGPTGTMAIAIMVTIFLVACLGLLRGWLDLRAQEAALAAAAAQLRDLARRPVVEHPEEAEENPFDDLFPASATVENAVGGHPGHVLEVVRKHGRLATPSVEAILDAARSYSPPGLERQRATQNVILLVGLAGTVFGLAAAIGEVQLGTLGGAAANSASLAVSAFERVLEKLPTAFVSTIWGILLALIYGPIAAGLEGRTARFTTQLSQEAVGSWIPELWPEGAEAQLEDLRQVMATTQETIRRAGSEMHTATTGLSGVLKSVSNEMGLHVTKLAEVTDESQGMFSRLSTEVTASVAALQSGTQEMSSSIQRLREFHADVTDAYSRMQELFARAQDDARRQIENTLEVTKNQQNQFGNVTSDLFIRLDNMTGRFDASTAELQKQNDSIVLGFSEIGLQLNRAVDGVLDTSVQRFMGATNELRQAIEPLDKAVSGLESLVSGSLAGGDGHRALSALASAVSELEQASKGLVEAIGSANGVTPRLTTLTDRLDALPNRLAAVAEEVGKLAASAAREAALEQAALLTNLTETAPLSVTGPEASLPTPANANRHGQTAGETVVIEPDGSAR